ncbi:MAG: hypothetical protein EA405_00140 [Rhodospirillales bacterium]|nr:MAG: hypothetical protein EA405_00140 [Rhodospirillales bacterium]
MVSRPPGPVSPQGDASGGGVGDVLDRLGQGGPDPGGVFRHGNGGGNGGVRSQCGGRPGRGGVR